MLVKSNVDPDHWLGAGVAPTLNVLASGYMWEQNRKQMAYKLFVVAQQNGRGYVIGFTQDPNVRAYLDDLNVIFMNAILRGSAHARPVR